MLKATSNGLRQQSVARRAVIKVSCLPKILPSVVFCTTLKPNEEIRLRSLDSTPIFLLAFLQMSLTYSVKVS